MYNTTKLEKSEVIDFLTEANSGSTNLLAAVELVPIDELVILEKNPRKHPKKQIFKIKKSIDRKPAALSAILLHRAADFSLSLMDM